MVELLALWERGWFEPRVEKAVWSQLSAAFSVERMMFVPRRVGFGEEFDSIEEALATTSARPVFLSPWEGVELPRYAHPPRAVYVFGNAQDGNQRWFERGDVVRIPTPASVDMFGHDAAAIVLYDRLMKGASLGDR